MPITKIDLNRFLVTPESMERSRKRKEELHRKRFGLVEIELTKKEIAEAEEIAELRYKSGDVFNGFVGALGELAVEKFLMAADEKKFDQLVDREQRPLGDEGYDMVWNRLRIEVKCTRKHFSDIELRVPHPHDADLFVMTKAYRKNGGWSVDLIGWITLEEYLKEERPNFFGEDGVSRNKLRKISEWIEQKG